MIYEIGAKGLVRIDVPNNHKKNNLPVGTILQLQGYDCPDYVVVKNEGVNERFPSHGARYICVNLNNYAQVIEDAYCLKYLSEKKDSRIQVYITDKVMPADEVLDVWQKHIEADKQRKIDAENEAKRRDEERQEMRKTYSNLTLLESAPKKSRWCIGAKNIRIELKKAFPGVKFSVTSESYSGGCSINAHWTDGPTSEEVEKFTNKYQDGNFNGMEDIYEYSNSQFPDLFGGAKYVVAQRNESKEAIKSVALKMGFEVEQNEWGSITNLDREDELMVMREVRKTTL